VYLKRVPYSDQEQGNVNKSVIGPRLFNERRGFFYFVEGELLCFLCSEGCGGD